MERLQNIADHRAAGAGFFRGLLRGRAAKARQGENGGEFWLGFTNFYVITKYNRSVLYAMAAYQLSQEVKAAYEATLPPTTVAASAH